MAVYEDLSHDRRHGRPVLASAMEHPLERVRLGLVALLVGLWLVAAYAGIVYWSVQGSLLGVLASAAVSGLAAAATWTLYVRLASQQAGDADERNM